MTKEEIEDLGIEALITRDNLHDPKYSFTQGRVLHREKNYLLPVDEPYYVLRGNDIFAPQMAHYYHEVLKGEDPSDIVLGHIETSSERVEAFKTYHEKYPDMIGKMYPEVGCSCIVEPPVMMGTQDDPMHQNSEWFPWDYTLFHRDFHFFIQPEEPLMVFRGKDAILVMIMNKHVEFIKEHPEQYQSPQVMINYIEEQIKRVSDFHLDNPHRIGVACTIYQKPKGAEYSAALEIAEKNREAALQENNLEDAKDKFGKDQAKGEYNG